MISFPLFQLLSIKRFITAFVVLRIRYFQGRAIKLRRSNLTDHLKQLTYTLQSYGPAGKCDIANVTHLQSYKAKISSTCQNVLVLIKGPQLDNPKFLVNGKVLDKWERLSLVLAYQSWLFSLIACVPAQSRLYAFDQLVAFVEKSEPLSNVTHFTL